MLFTDPIERAVERISASGGVPLRLELWDGRVFDLAPTPHVTVRLQSAAALRYLASPSLSSLGEAFVEGHLQVQGRIHDVFRAGAALALSGGGPGRGALPRLLAHSRGHDRKAIAYHYDVSNEFYALFLDAGMVYSCAYFQDEDDSLEAAQAQKLDHVLRKLRLKPGERLLDIGCGWGALILHAAQRYGAYATGITLSEKQHDLAQVRIREAGLEDRCSVKLLDYRDLSGDATFDKISSVGIHEHVGLKNLPAFFGKAAALLRPGGLFLNHGIASSDTRERSVGAGVGDFIERYVFPNGELPHLSRVVRDMAGAGLEVADVESLRRHYAATCQMWADRLEGNRERAVELAGEKRVRIWQIYLAGCAHAFAHGWIDIHQVLACKSIGGDAGDLPMTREDLYRH